MRLRIFRLSIMFVAIITTLFAMIGGFGPNAVAQDSLPTKIDSPPDESTVRAGETQLTGWLNSVTGDPQDPTLTPSVEIITLDDDNGALIAVLDVSTARVRPYYGQYVTVTGTLDSTRSNESRLFVRNVLPAAVPRDGGLRDLRVVSGAQPWVNLLCKFADNSSEPKPVSYFDGLFNNTNPGLDHYWRQLSYNTINIVGTSTQPWRVLPQPRSYYVVAGTYGANLDRLFDDCTAAHNATVNFPTFVGINLMFNADLDCCARGGSKTLNADGQTKIYRVTWDPPWAQVHNVLAHEMGHGFGFPHSTGPANNPPSELSIYVSQWDMMSASSGTCAVFSSTYDCIAPGTITNNLRNAGWIPPNRIVTVASGTQTITLERTLLPSSTTNTQMIVVPINGSSTRYYTVETRNLNAGYDQNIPASAVIIHNVDTSRSGNGGDAYVVDADTANTNTNDAGARWLPGETYTNSTDGVTIAVLSQSGTTYSVRVTNTAPPPPPPPTNDAFANAIAITPPTTRTQNNISGSTVDPSDPAMCTSRSSTVWYKFTLPSATTVNLNTVGSNYDTVLGVYTGSAGNLTQVACNDDSSGVTSSVSFAANAGTTYYVLVAKFSTTPAAAGTNMTLNFSTSAPTNLVTNGTFNSALAPWTSWGVATQINSGALELSRLAGSASGGVVQETPYSVSANTVLEMTVRLRNTTNNPRQMSLVLRSSTWSQAWGCQFNVAAEMAFQTFKVRARASTAWSALAVQLNVETVDGQMGLLIDDVVVSTSSGAPTSGVQCTLPGSANLLSNGNFTNGLNHWFVFGGGTGSGVSGGILNMRRQVATASGGVIQEIPQPLLAGQSNIPFDIQLELGNTSGVSRGTTIILRGIYNWENALGCLFNIPAYSARQTYTMRIPSDTTLTWSQIALQLNVEIADGQAGLQVDNVVLRHRPDLSFSNVGCYLPGQAPLEDRGTDAAAPIQPTFIPTALAIPYSAPAMPAEVPLIVVPSAPTEATTGEGTTSE